MKFIIHGKCRKCGLEGLAEDIYKHQGKEHDNFYGVDLNQEEILNALIQISLKDIINSALDKGSYASIAESLSDWSGNDVYGIVNNEWFGDDVVDVIDSLKGKDTLIKKQFQEHLKSFKIELTSQKNTKVENHD